MLDAQRFFVVLGCAALVACGPSINPQTKARVDAWRGALSSGEQVFHQAGVARPPFESGQWAEYLEIDSEGRPAQVTYKIVGREGNAFWMETERTSYLGHDVAKMLLEVPDWQQPSGWVFRRIIMQKDAEPPQEMPPFLLGMVGNPILSGLRFEVQDQPPETITVPAGAFQGAVASRASVEVTGLGKFESVTWVHGRVPVTGYLKTASADGKYRAELTAFGDTGAESAIVGAVTPIGVP